MAIALSIFFAGRRSYKTRELNKTNIFTVFEVVFVSFKEKMISDEQRESFLDYGKKFYSDWLVEDVKRILSILFLFLPIPLFWSLFDQQGSRWTFQAMQMGLSVGFITVKPEQIQILNAVLILICIPLFDRVIYPFARNIGIKCLPLSKMLCGLIFASLSFVASALVQASVDKGTFSGTASDYSSQVCVSNCTNVLWQIPQYILITIAEIMVSVTGLEFAYSQSPVEMKSVCQSLWLFTIAIGNLVVVFLTWLNPFFSFKNSLVLDYLLYSGILGLATVLFYFISRNYKYRVVVLDNQ